ncbi:ABC transporter permease [Plantactinospora sp. ZYX-F-223]|uniref:ABC transporter permease n=1 Tax=Plantactinospora sp. ZYX-F-223 TaxID=3144103 RepID=UPI0031FCD0C8
MSTMAHSLADSTTMLGRNLKHALRYPSLSLSTALMPILFLLLFAYVFGGAMGTGIGGASRSDYINYLSPGIILMTAAAGCVSAAISVCMDMSEGIVARFRTMSISRGSFLTGHVVGSMVQTLVAVALVTGVALLIGFRPDATAPEWFAAAGVLVMVAFALIWLSVALGLAAKTPETASNMPLPLTLLPMIGSGFVPAESMPGWLQAFAKHQPFTPIIETLRGLLMGTPIGNSAWIAATWCAGIALVGYIWSRMLFRRDPSK